MVFQGHCLLLYKCTNTQGPNNPSTSQAIYLFTFLIFFLKKKKKRQHFYYLFVYYLYTNVSGIHLRPLPANNQFQADCYCCCCIHTTYPSSLAFLWRFRGVGRSEGLLQARRECVRWDGMRWSEGEVVLFFLSVLSGASGVSFLLLLLGCVDSWANK